MPPAHREDPDRRGVQVPLPDQRDVVREPPHVAAERVQAGVRIPVVIDQQVGDAEAAYQRVYGGIAARRIAPAGRELGGA